MDLYAQPFQLDVQKNKKRQSTKLGIVLSSVTILGSITFLILLLIDYDNGNISPKVTSYSGLKKQNIYNPTTNIIPFHFSMASNTNIYPQDFENPLQYFNIKIFQQTHNQELTEFDIDSCQNLYPNVYSADTLTQRFDYCINPNNQQIQLIKDLNNEDLNKRIIIQILECDSSLFQCKPDDKILDFFQNKIYDIRFNLHIQTSEFDTKEKKQIYLSQNFQQFLEPSLGLNTLVKLTKSELQIDKSLFKGIADEIQYIQNIEIQSTTNTPEFLASRFSNNLNQQKIYNLIQLELSHIVRFNKVEYPKLMELFAQFFSMLNCMFFIGIIGVTASESQLYENLFNIYVKYYYSSFQNNELETGQASGTLNKIIPQNSEEKSYVVPDIYEEDYPEKLKEYNPIKFSLKRKLILNFMPSKNLKCQKEQMYTGIKEKLNINEIYKDLLHLKNCVQLLLTNEQYSSIYYVQRNYMKIQEKSRNIQDDQIDLNKPENSELIEQNTQIRLQYLKDYVKKYNKQQDQNQQQKRNIDDEIISSLPQKLLKWVEIQEQCNSDRYKQKLESQQL